MATMAAKSRSSPPRISVMGAPRRADSVTLSSASVTEATSKPAGGCSGLMFEKRSAIAAPSRDALSSSRSTSSRAKPLLRFGGIEQHPGHVVETDAGQETLTPAEFAARYEWRNDLTRVPEGEL